MCGFSHLPDHVVDNICSHLNVNDRAMLNVALYRCSGDKKKTIREKKLGVLFKAIRKRRINKLSLEISKFIGTIDKSSDPTVQEMQQYFPEIAHILPSKKDVDDVCVQKKLDLGIFSTNDIDFLMRESPTTRALMIARIRSIDVFCATITDSRAASIWKLVVESMRHLSLFAFNIVNYCNHTLLDHLQSHAHCYGLDFETLKDCIVTDVISQLKHRRVCCKFVLERFSIPQSTLRDIYSDCVLAMNTDDALYFEQIMLDSHNILAHDQNNDDDKN
jgi:hypothetical protein